MSWTPLLEVENITMAGQTSQFREYVLSEARVLATVSPAKEQVKMSTIILANFFSS